MRPSATLQLHYDHNAILPRVNLKILTLFIYHYNEQPLSNIDFVFNIISMSVWTYHFGTMSSLRSTVLVSGYPQHNPITLMALVLDFHIFLLWRSFYHRFWNSMTCCHCRFHLVIDHQALFDPYEVFSIPGRELYVYLCYYAWFFCLVSVLTCLP